jgi:hypothetical protein
MDSTATANQNVITIVWLMAILLLAKGSPRKTTKTIAAVIQLKNFTFQLKSRT